MSRATRRGVMGGMAALIPTMAAVPAVAAPRPDAELIAACARYIAAERVFSNVCKAEPEDGSPAMAAWEAEEACTSAERQARVDEVLPLPCTSLSGVLALTRALIACKPEVLTPRGYDEEELLARLVRAVLAMGG